MEMLDIINNTVYTIESNLIAIETCVHVLKKTEHKQSNITQGIFKDTNGTQNDLENKQRDCTVYIN